MKLKLQLKRNLVGAAAALGISLFSSFTAQAQTNVTVDANDEWIGAMLVYANSPQQEYLWYSDWGISDIKTEVNTSNNTLTLYPNYNMYSVVDPADPTYWQVGENGNKIMLGISLVIDNSLVGQDFTFSGTVSSYTLSDAYTVKAFAKVLDANWNQIVEYTTDITEEGNFTVACNATNYPADHHVQYGFMVRGINANPTTMAANGNVVVTAGDPVIEEPETVTVTLDTNNEGQLLGYANWFDLNGGYIGGDVYGVADIRTDVDAENNTFILYPNFLAYGDGSDPAWANGEIGAKIFEGNTYVEDNNLLGEEVNFVGRTISNTLAEGYEGVAFIKVMSATYDLLNYTTAELIGGENFSILVNVGDYPAAAHVQYGYSVTGLNANPNQEAALGNAVVSSPTMAVPAVESVKTVIYPNPATTVLNIAAQGTVENVKVYNMMGQKVLETKGTTVDVAGLNSGMYIISTTVNGNESTTRFVKK